MIVSRRMHGLSACVLALVLSACGSTVQYQQTQGVAGSGTESGLGGGGVPVAPTSSAPASVATSGGSPTNGTGSSQVSPGGIAGTSSAAPTPAAPPAPALKGAPVVTASTIGVTKSVVRIGVITAQSAGTVFAAAGVSGAGGQASQKDMAAALFNQLNVEGGIAGRRYEPVFYEIDIAGNGSSQYQAACAKMATDAKVFAVIVLPSAQRSLYDCLKKYGVIALGSSDDYLLDESYMLRSVPDTYLAPESLALSAFAATYPLALSDMGFFTPGAKIGVLYGNTPIERNSYNNYLVPTLSKLGRKVEAAISLDGSTTTDYSPFVLRMRSAGVTHMLYLGQVSGILFMLAAESQGYRPKHGLHSRQGPRVLQSAVPASQQKGAMSVGWQPASDVDPSRWPKSSAQLTRCTAIMKKAGIDTSDALSGYTAQLLCANGFFLNDALHRATAFVAHEFRLAAESFGSTHPPVSTFGQRIDAQHHDGVAYYRPSAFDDSCSCYTYTGAVRPLRRLVF